MGTVSGKNHGRYTTGYTLVNHFCTSCGIKIGFNTKTEMCRSCSGKNRWIENKIQYNHKLDCICSICKLKRGELKGPNHPAFIHGLTSLQDKIRGLQKSTDWKFKVFKRDNYVCMDCFHRGGDLQAHHIKPFRIIFKEFLQEYNQFSPIEDKETLLKLAIKYESFWDVSNGETLCEPCHRKTFKNDREISII